MRIFLADHHPQALLALKMVLQERNTFELIGEASDAESLLAQAVTCSMDLALIDWELPGKSIDEVITLLHASTPKPIVVVMGSQPEYGRMLLQAGADAFVSKGDQPDWLIETLEKFNKQTKKNKTG